MTHKDSVLVIADQNPDISGTIALARRIAEAQAVHLTVVGFTKMDKADPTFRPSLEETVKRACKGFDDHDLMILDDTDIAGWVIDHCALGKARLVVKTGHRSETIFYSPIDWRLIRENPAPVLFVNGAENHSAMKTVMATVDVEDESKEQRALDQTVMEEAETFARILTALSTGRSALKPLVSCRTLTSLIRASVNRRIRLRCGTPSRGTLGILISPKRTGMSMRERRTA